MAKTFKGIAGNLAEQRVHLRDSRHAAENFGLNKAYLGHGTPRQKFQFFVVFRFNTDRYVMDHVANFLDRPDQKFISAMVKTAEMPSMKIDTEILNQYNRKIVSQTKIQYDPINITFHDTVDGKTLRLWEMYYEYYFRDGVAPEKLQDSRTQRPEQFTDTIRTAEFRDNFGYNIQRVFNQKYLFDAIDIYQVHGGEFSRVRLVRPRISAFKHDTLDYAASADLVELQMTFEYETALYSNVNEDLNDEEIERYERGDFWEMANLITIRNDVQGRSIETQAQFPAAPASTLPNQEDAEGKSGIFGRLASRVGMRLGGTVQGVVDSIPDAIGSAVSTSIFGGKISLDPDPVKAVKTGINAAGRDIIGTSRRAVTEGVADIFKKGEEEPPEEEGP